MTFSFRRATEEALALARQAWLVRHDIERPAWPDRACPGDDVVICLHGLCATAGVLRPLRRHIEQRSGVHTASMTYAVGPGIEALAEKLGELMAQLPELRIHLLGHSVGGVVARYYAQEIGDPRIMQTISLGSPFAGIRHAARLSIQIATDMDPQSALLRKVRLGAGHPGAIPHLSLVAENDYIVKRPLSHALPGHEVKLIANCGHQALLFRKDVAALVDQNVQAFAKRD